MSRFTEEETLYSFEETVYSSTLFVALNFLVRRCSVTKVFSEITQNSQESTRASAQPATLLKRDPGTGAFL